VTLFNKVTIGPPTENEIGEECRFCRTKIISGKRVYTCHSCGRPLHLEEEEKPESERLQCALLCTACPTCETPILREQGYSYLPELSKPL